MLPAFDLLLVVLSLSAFGFIGFYFRPKNEANSAEYFLARRKMTVVPAAFSITVTYISTSGLVLYPGEVAMFACPLYATALAYLLSGTVAVIFVLNKFYDSGYLSIFQFLEHRFSRSVRIMNSLIFVLTGLVNIAVVGYTVALAAEVLAGIPFWLSVVTVCLMSTAYSTMGGIRAVIWTDVCQALLMVLYLLLICFKAVSSFESFAELSTVISNGQRAKIMFSESTEIRYSLQSFTVYFTIFYLYMLCGSQPGMQRWKSVKTLKEAKWTVIVSLVFSTFFTCLIFVTGLLLYAFYARCAKTNGHAPTSDKLSLYFVLKELSSWPGAQGLCLIGLLSGALSTLSSYLNSLAAVTLEDFVKMRFKSLSDKRELTISKSLTVIYGALSTTLIFVASLSPAVAIVQVVALSISTGPPLGTFFLGMWAKRSNALGVSLGLGVSVVLVSCLSIGSALRGNRHLPLPSPQCPSNTTSIVGIMEQEILDHLPTVKRGFLDCMYEVSVYWYSLISFLTSFCLGYLFSICIAHFRRGRKDVDDEGATCDEVGQLSHPNSISTNLLPRLEERNFLSRSRPGETEELFLPFESKGPSSNPRLSRNCKVTDDERHMEMCGL